MRARYRRRTRTIACAAEERYLRDDVPCGVRVSGLSLLLSLLPAHFLELQDCPHCPELSLTSSSLDADAPAYLIPDAAALEQFLEVELMLIAV